MSKQAKWKTMTRHPSCPPCYRWDNCEHDWWYPADSRHECDVYCIKCGCPGMIGNTLGVVYWPTT